MKNSVENSVFSGLFWKFGERITAQLVSLLVSIKLAQLLPTDDFGVVTIVMVFITIANVFVSNGFGNALVQKKDADNLDFSSVFYVNLIISFVVYIAIFLSAPYISLFYEMPVLTWAIRILGIRIIVAAINSIQHAYISRHMMFKRFFWSTLFGTVISGVIGIYMAYKGCGVWSLIVQYLTNTCIDTVVLWFTVKWRPVFKFSFSRVKTLISFGWKLLLSGLIDTGYSQLRNLLIGKIYTPSDLAYYNQGDKYPQVLVVNINTSIGSVLFPAMSKCQDDRLKVTRAAIQVSSYIIWPLMIGLAAIAPLFVRVILSEKWMPCVPFIQVFCLSYGLWPIHTCNLQAINALGRSDLFLKMEIIKKILGLMVMIITLKMGTFAIAVGLVITGIISTFINSYPNRKLLHYAYIEQLGDILPPFLLSLLMAVCIIPIEYLGFHKIITLVLQIVIGVLVYLTGSIITKPKGFIFIRTFIANNKVRKISK